VTGRVKPLSGKVIVVGGGSSDSSSDSSTGAAAGRGGMRFYDKVRMRICFRWELAAVLAICACNSSNVP
jgi:hypothetical protein